MVVHLWQSSPSGLFCCVPSVVGLNKRRVNAVDGIRLSGLLIVFSDPATSNLVTRGASFLAGLSVRFVLLRSFGGGREQASRKRCRRCYV